MWNQSTAYEASRFDKTAIMDPWVNLILQWVNCLQDSTDHCISTIEELQDGEIYYMLINKLKPWNHNEYCDTKKTMVLQYLKDEYPYFKLQNISIEVQHVCIALLILSRLSLEPIFHKSLCTHLNLDLQIKIRSILENIYSLGKNVSEEEFCKTFSLLDKNDLKTFSTKSKHILHEFLNSPAIRSVQSEKKMFEQNKQMRHLRADLETLRYEKSELIEDIKTQRKKIEELQNKLQDSSVELKILRQENSTNNLHCSCNVDTKSNRKIESAYQKEVESLEKYVAELQNDNCVLQDEKNNLISQMKMYKVKYCEMEEQNLNNEQILESVYLQIEKKDEELIEIKMKYEELRSYLIERSMNMNNQSIELDDKFISEMSLNKSEALSSVIEIQLQETKKEMSIIQYEYQYLNTILTMVMEEYFKLKRKFDIVSIDTTEKKYVKDKTSRIVKHKHENTVINFKTEKIFIPNKIELLFTFVFRDSSKRRKNILFFLNLLNTSGICKDIKRLEKNVLFVPCAETSVNNNSEINNDLLVTGNKSIENFTDLNISKSFKLYNRNNAINYNNLQRHLLTFYKTLSEENWHLQAICFVKRLTKTIKQLSQNEKLIKLLNNSLTNREILEYNRIFDSVRNNTIQYTKNIPNNIQHSNTLIFNENDLKVLQMTWISLYKSIQNNIKIYKIFLLLEKNWNLIFESFNDISKCDSDNDSLLNQLSIKKDKIEKELKILNYKNVEALSMNFIAAVYFSTAFSKKFYQKSAYNHKQTVVLTKTLSHSILDMCNFNFEDHNQLNIQKENYIAKIIIDIKRRIDNFDESILMCKENEKFNTVPIYESENKENKESTIIITTDNVDISKTKQFQNYIKEVHEKYELKLEKMKDKMKSVYNSQISTIKKEQEIMSKKQLDSLKLQFDQQCKHHSEELKKYKKHITDLTSQLWDVGDKLINEKQKKETYEQKLHEIKVKYENSDIKNIKSIKPESECFNDLTIKSEKKLNTRNSVESDSENKMESLRGFQIMGNAFSTEDEEGEVFDTTYLTDMQRSRQSLTTIDMNRLSILQMRNAKCKPHLKSSYPAEMNFHPIPCTEDEIKTGTTEEVFNDSLSQSLLTGKKVKRKDRARNSTETPRTRRFSNIFRKPRLSVDRK